MSTHGGAREGSGRKAKYYHPETGEPLETRPSRVPTLLTEKDIQDAANKKIKELDKQTT